MSKVACRMVQAYKGRDGVVLAQTAHSDIVLLDMNLPDIPGLDLVRELGVLISQRGLRVVLLTADSFSIDLVKALGLQYLLDDLARRHAAT